MDEKSSSTDLSKPRKSSSKEFLSHETSSKSGREDSDKRETDNEQSSNDITLTNNNNESDKIDERSNSDNARKKFEPEDGTLMSYYPNVPGSLIIRSQLYRVGEMN